MIQLSKPCLGTEELQSINQVFNSSYLGLGRTVFEFENQLAQFVNNEVVCVSSGTAALHLSLEALGVGPGDEVLVQGLTFVATFQAIVACGATPIPCDVDEKDLTICIDDAERKLSESTKVIIPVHYAGNPGNVEKVYAFAKKYNLRVVEDAAHSFGGKYKDKIIGSFGDIVCFSFDPIKTLTCGEGGAIVSKDAKLISKVKEFRFLGIKRRDSEIMSTIKYKVVDRGWRYHMNNVNAAIGITQLKKIDHIINKRRYICKMYLELLGNFKEVELLPYNYNEITPYIFVVKLLNCESSYVLGEMIKKSIECGNHYFPPHLEPYFQKTVQYKLPHVEKIYKMLLSLPLHCDLTEDNLKTIVTNLKKSVQSI